MASILWALVIVGLISVSDGFSTNRTQRFDKISSDIKVIKQTYMDMFSEPRSNTAEKDPVRHKVISIFKKFGLETVEQEFDYFGRTGINLIGIRAGKNRGVSGKTDNIIVVASHWDTVSRAPGVDDNGSGSVAVVEVARILHESKADLDHTVIFVCNDLEELGLKGSQAFVDKWLIPNELVGKDVNFLGAYVMDMDLFYDPRPDSQSIPYDIERVSVSTKDLHLLM